MNAKSEPGKLRSKRNSNDDICGLHDYFWKFKTVINLCSFVIHFCKWKKHIKLLIPSGKLIKERENLMSRRAKFITDDCAVTPRNCWKNECWSVQRRLLVGVPLLYPLAHFELLAIATMVELFQLNSLLEWVEYFPLFPGISTYKYSDAVLSQ